MAGWGCASPFEEARGTELPRRGQPGVHVYKTFFSFVTDDPSLVFEGKASGLYYKHVTVVNYASSSVNKLRASLNDDARVIIYDHHIFIVKATGAWLIVLYLVTRKH
jgi:hypothetical protein